MREVKFRAVRLDTGEWIYGDLHLHSPFPHIHSTRGDKAKIDTNTIGQFADLHDKNGKEVYEGDIIIERLKRSRKDGERLVVCFEEFEWKAKNTNGATTSLSLLVEYYTVEVIGNIHDNPELLKNK